MSFEILVSLCRLPLSLLPHILVLLPFSTLLILKQSDFPNEQAIDLVNKPCQLQFHRASMTGQTRSCHYQHRQKAIRLAKRGVTEHSRRQWRVTVSFSRVLFQIWSRFMPWKQGLQYNQKVKKTISKRMIYQDNYYPFMMMPNFYPYYYPMAPHLSFLPTPNCQTTQEPQISVPLSTTLSKESSSQELKEISTIVKKENRGADSDFISEDKVSRSLVTVPQQTENMPVSRSHKGEVKLDFRIEWKNENRNIVPNLINQMVSYLLKKIKSEKLVKRIFDTLPHEANCTIKKFYLYMKKIKESITHYVNQNVILKFMEIHEPKCELYDFQEQLFYMRVSRIAIIKFLQDDAVLISLTSNRMSQIKRKIHLIARDALLKKFQQLCQQVKH